MVSVQAQHLARLMASIARHHVKVPTEQQNRLDAICRALGRQSQPGLTERNRAKLRQFDDPEMVGRMLLLPGRLMQGVSRTKPPSLRDALRVQIAVAIEILSMVPLRVKNLVSLEIDRHLRRLRKGGMHLHVPLAEVKNRVEINAPLQPETARLIILYLERYRPVLAGPEVPWLFPGKDGQAKSTDQMRAQIIAVVKELEGLDITPHFARHFAARHYLDAHPGACGVIRLVLGHKSANTVTRHYADIDTNHAMRQFGEHVTGSRHDAKALAAERQADKPFRRLGTPKAGSTVRASRKPTCTPTKGEE